MFGACVLMYVCAYLGARCKEHLQQFCCVLPPTLLTLGTFMQTNCQESEHSTFEIEQVA
jgi:hypothetical protein